MSKECHFSFDNLGKKYASCLKLIHAYVVKINLVFPRVGRRWWMRPSHTCYGRVCPRAPRISRSIQRRSPFSRTRLNWRNTSRCCATGWGAALTSSRTVTQVGWEGGVGRGKETHHAVVRPAGMRSSPYHGQSRRWGESGVWVGCGRGKETHHAAVRPAGVGRSPRHGQSRRWGVGGVWVGYRNTSRCCATGWDAALALSRTVTQVGWEWGVGGVWAG